MNVHYTAVDADETKKMKAAIASTLGGDVSSEDITFSKIHFPVKAKLKLSTSMVWGCPTVKPELARLVP